MRLEAKDIHFRYGHDGPLLLHGVNLSLAEGERVGLVGASGCGKSTLLRLLAGYERPLAGQVLLDGAPLPAKGFSPVQLIHQHPEEAINPRWKLRRVLEEAAMDKEEVMDAMGIERAWLDRYPRELSGGELQRFCIARSSLAEGTRFLLADEISTMLDVVTQAQIWQLVLSQAEKRRLGLLMVTHNAALAERICTRIIRLAELTT